MEIQDGNVIQTNKIPLNVYITQQKAKIDLNTQALLDMQSRAERIIADTASILTELESLS